MHFIITVLVILRCVMHTQKQHFSFRFIFRMYMTYPNDLFNVQFPQKFFLYVHKNNNIARSVPHNPYTIWRILLWKTSKLNEFYLSATEFKKSSVNIFVVCHFIIVEHVFFCILRWFRINFNWEKVT